MYFKHIGIKNISNGCIYWLSLKHIMRHHLLCTMFQRIIFILLALGTINKTVTESVYDEVSVSNIYQDILKLHSREAVFETGVPYNFPKLSRLVENNDLGVEYNSSTKYKLIQEELSEEEYLQKIKDFIFPPPWTWVLITFHFLVFIGGLFGNLLVCSAVYRNHRMRTVTNYFIVNLAVADFMVILICLPPSVIWDVTSTWFFGTVMCKIVLYLQTVSVSVSVLTLTCISVDRWYAICFPIKFKSTTRRAKTGIVLIWIISLLFDLPELIVYHSKANEQVEIETIYFTQCEPTWSRAAETNWTILKIIFLYVLPVGFMTLFYIQISRVLWRSGTTSHRHGTVENGHFQLSTNSSSKGHLHSRKKAAKMLVFVVGIFAFCYFPVHLLSILRLTVELKNTDFSRAFALISHWLCYANSAVNPLIYNFMSAKFRKEFRKSIYCRTRSLGSSNRQRYEMHNTNNRNIRSCSGFSIRSDTLRTRLDTSI